MYQWIKQVLKKSQKKVTKNLVGNKKSTTFATLLRERA